MPWTYNGAYKGSTRKNADRQLKVRIGINVGEAIKEDSDFFGTAVVVAARIMAEASENRSWYPTSFGSWRVVPRGCSIGTMAGGNLRAWPRRSTFMRSTGGDEANLTRKSLSFTIAPLPLGTR